MGSTQGVNASSRPKNANWAITTGRLSAASERTTLSCGERKPSPASSSNATAVPFPGPGAAESRSKARVLVIGG